MEMIKMVVTTYRIYVVQNKNIYQKSFYYEFVSLKKSKYGIVFVVVLFLFSNKIFLNEIVSIYKQNNTKKCFPNGVAFLFITSKTFYDKLISLLNIIIKYFYEDVIYPYY